MNASGMQLQIVPASGDIVTSRIRAVESEKNEGLLHHLLRLERDGQLRVFVGDIIGRIRREWSVCRHSEYHGWLRLL